MSSLITIGKGLYLAGSFTGCSHALKKEAHRLSHSSSRLTTTEKYRAYHNVAALGFAISSIVFFRFQMISDLFNGMYYSTNLSSGRYDEKSELNSLGISKRSFFLFGAATSAGLILSSTLALPAALVLAIDVAGIILTSMEAGIFLHAMHEAASNYLMPNISSALITV